MNDGSKEQRTVQSSAAVQLARRDGVDGDIEAAIRGGDHRQALVLCARHYGEVIGRLCMSLTGSQHDAEDLTQETLLDAHSGFGGWRGEGSARAWLLSIARRKCARHLEKKTRRGAKLRLIYDRDRDRSPDSSRSEQAVLLKQRAERARAALAELRPSEREALLLRYGAELSYQEIGQACGVDEAAARKRVSRAVATLRDTLQDQQF
jgi:RNA polymerase sigma-70 factor (ECF subfamily)